RARRRTVPAFRARRKFITTSASITHLAVVLLGTYLKTNALHRSYSQTLLNMAGCIEKTAEGASNGRRKISTYG
ncbi:MAG: hypothetical protein ACKPKO_48320, partial [Candidatus Fonsibacter sp.]